MKYKKWRFYVSALSVSEAWQAGLVGVVWEAAILQGDLGQNLPGFSTVFPGRARYSICCCLYQLRKEFAVQKLGQPPSLEQNKLCFYPTLLPACLRLSVALQCSGTGLAWPGTICKISSGWAPLIIPNLLLCLNILAAVFWNSSEFPLKSCADYPCSESTYLKFSSFHTKLAIQVMNSLFLGLCIHPSGRSCFPWEEML